MTKYQTLKLQEARRLLGAAHGGSSRRTRRRLEALREELNVDRRRRLAALAVEVTPRRSGGSVGLRLDPQGRLRPVTWETGEVLVRREAP